jgi:transglutaminase-like putative cysteine protease
MSNAQTVQDVVDQIVTKTATECEKAIALHNYVRDRVKFGFSKYFDAAKPDYTLNCGVGHCNPKTRLMVTLFQACGLEAYQHFVAIPKDILNGALPPSRSFLLPPQLSHSYTEVKVEGNWCAIDSYIVDTALLTAAQAKLAKEGLSLGYGVRSDSTNIWDGKTSAFSQFAQTMMLEDHGRVTSLESYFRSREYRHQFLGVRFNTVFALIGDLAVAPINSHLEGIRRQSTQ